MDSFEVEEKALGASVRDIGGRAVRTVTGRKPRSARVPDVKPDMTLDPDEDGLAGEGTIFEGPVQKARKFLKSALPNLRRDEPLSSVEAEYERRVLDILPGLGFVTRRRRRANAQKSSRTAKRVAMDAFKPLTEADGSDMLFDDRIMNLVMTAQRLGLRPPEDGTRTSEWLADLLKEFVDSGHIRMNNWEDFEFQVDDDSVQDLMDILTLSAHRSPAMAEIMRRYPSPRVVQFQNVDDYLLAEFGQSEFDVVNGLQGLYMTQHGFIGLNSRSVKLDLDEPDEPVGPLGAGGVNQSMESTFRHEMGHHMTWFTQVFGSADQIDGLGGLLQWYKDNITPDVIRLREELKQLADDDVEEAIRMMVRSGVPIDKSLWMTQYGTTSNIEFLAEIFMMATSASPAVRESIPAELRALVDKWLGIDASGLMKDVKVSSKLNYGQIGDE